MLNDELKIASEIVKEAGKIVLSFYHQNYAISLKKEDEPVTQADKASNEFITERLRHHFPKDAILAEESKDDFRRLNSRRVWLVDPMDGTREFIDKVGQFTVMIGLVEDGRPVLGVVYQPTTDKLYSAVKEEGTFVSVNGESKRLLVTDISEMSQMRLVVSRSHRASLVDKMKTALGIRQEVSSGSVGLKVGLMVESRCDLYLHPNSKTKEWDTCAPQIILEEAGGKFTDCWGEPLRYNQRNVYNEKGFVSSNGRVHKQILETIRPLLSELT